MDAYVAGGLVLVLLAGTIAAGVQVWGAAEAVRAVEAALAVAEAPLSLDGCVSERVRGAVHAALLAQGLRPAEARLEGTGCEVPHYWGEPVSVTLRYPWRMHLGGGLLELRERPIVIVRKLTVTSAVVPGGSQ